jgi:hypothetical protein
MEMSVSTFFWNNSESNAFCALGRLHHGRCDDRVRARQADGDADLDRIGGKGRGRGEAHGNGENASLQTGVHKRPLFS